MFRWLWGVLAWLFPRYFSAKETAELAQRFKAALGVWGKLEKQELSAPRVGSAEVEQVPLRLGCVDTEFGVAPPAHTTLLHKVGEGSYGVVYVFCLDGVDLAVKVSKVGEKENVRDEAALLRRRFDGVVPMLGCGSATVNGATEHYWITMPRMYSLPCCLTPHEAVVVGVRARRALVELVEARLCHGDVALPNMLYDGHDLRTVVLSDLGHANAHEDGNLLQRESYRPPYALEEALASLNLANRTDLYALGCVLMQAVYDVDHECILAEARRRMLEEPATDVDRMVQALLLCQ